ncbi:MAG TPA: hypothetical protein VIW23_04520 [Candidatus Acidoferrum sp.]|jgi:hypothetical protein
MEGVLVGIPLFFAGLAYPDSQQIQQRAVFAEAIHAWRFKECLRRGLKRKLVPASYRAMKNQKIYGVFSKGFTCIERRLTAGSMGCSLGLNGIKIPGSWLGAALPIPVVGAASVNKAAEAVLHGRANDCSQAPNVKHRIWAESLPALHLAVSLYMLGGQRWKSSPENLSFELLYSDSWLFQTLTFAEGLRKTLPSRISSFRSENAIQILPS